MNRRGLLLGLGAASVLLIPERKFFLPPAGGWPVPIKFNPGLYVRDRCTDWYYAGSDSASRISLAGLVDSAELYGIHLNMSLVLI